ncbi:MAG: hypothetical protein WC511_01730 [Candidatus Pacearchaeota archaeon]
MTDFEKIHSCPICREENTCARFDPFCPKCKVIYNIGKKMMNHGCFMCRSHKATITEMQSVLERKNKELDALHFVWCSGGCKGGVHRYHKEEVTEELVTLAEKNVRMLRLWWENKQHRKEGGYE